MTQQTCAQENSLDTISICVCFSSIDESLDIFHCYQNRYPFFGIFSAEERTERKGKEKQNQQTLIDIVDDANACLSSLLLTSKTRNRF